MTVDPNTAFKRRHKKITGKNKHRIIFGSDHNVMDVCNNCNYQHEFVIAAGVPFSTKKALCPECNDAYMVFYYSPVKG